MSKNATRTAWLVLGLMAAFATNLHAAQKAKDSKDKEAEAEAKQSAQEDADEAADRAKGIKQKDRRTFLGRFIAVPDAGDTKGADTVVGQFTTSNADKKPGRTYLVKVEEGNKNTLKQLMHYDGKNAQLLGKLRVLDANGEGKYLVVNQVVEAAPTPPIEERRKPGGI